MDTAELDYVLPPGSIAQTPIEPRDAARLLVDGGPGRPPVHRHVRDLPALVGPDDLIVLNDTKVIPARLHLRKPTGGAVEVLLLERHPEGWWEALVRPSRRVAVGARLRPAAPEAADLEVEVGEVLGDDGRRAVTVHGGADDDLAVLAAVGEVPLPPYIHEPLGDVDRYQTVYARSPGSVAAPTAGLHLTDDVLSACRAAGAEVATVELVVGLGTFRPITTDAVEDHPMHAERYRIPDATREALDHGDRRVLAVGTTVVRALESYAASGEAVGATSLFIRDGHPWALVDRLLTNFHVPRSSLLVLVRAFVGPRWRDLYAVALQEGYRFLSFGDAMLLERARGEDAGR
ncbi:MAG: tRNA preQ1(34) S-adenosylmethionine ribosyltransferase-isomerase QueA [Acidimicrobiales bacterium]